MYKVISNSKSIDGYSTINSLNYFKVVPNYSEDNYPIKDEERGEL